MGELTHLIKKLAMRALLFPLRAFPVKSDRLVLNNGLSHNYSDNPKAVAESLLREHPGRFEIIFAVDDPAKHRALEGRGIRPVRFRSLKYFYYAMTAAVYLTNNGGYSYLPLRKRQLVIETWHGGGAYKRCGIWGYKNKAIGRLEMKLAAENLDVFLSTSRCSSELFSRSFLLPRGVFWEIGMPRNDKLICGDAAARERIRGSLGLPGCERLALFAPTFRQDRHTGAPAAIPCGIDCQRVCNALETRFTGTWRFAFRLHPGIRDRGGISARGCMDLSDHEDMRDLLCAADVLITDFSSSMWDFLLTGRPCFLFVPDQARCEREPGFFSPPSEWPFPLARDNAELEENILAFDEGRYAKACARHYAELGGCETGMAAKLVGERIYKYVFCLE